MEGHSGTDTESSARRKRWFMDWTSSSTHRGRNEVRAETIVGWSSPFVLSLSLPFSGALRRNSKISLSKRVSKIPIWRNKLCMWSRGYSVAHRSFALSTTRVMMNEGLPSQKELNAYTLHFNIAEQCMNAYNRESRDKLCTVEQVTLAKSSVLVSSLDDRIWLWVWMPKENVSKITCVTSFHYFSILPSQ